MCLKKEKAGIWKWIGLFFAAMILFTLLSRAIYQHGTAVVTTQMPTSGTIHHTVQITGKTVQNQEVAVTTIGGLRIGSVCVNEGQQVKQGDVLFLLDLTYLDETILKQEQDMKKQQLSIWDAWAQNSNAQKQKKNQQAQAEENYDNAVSQAQTAVERARRDLDRAKAALENYYHGITDDKAEEDALLLACQEAEGNLANAATTLEALEQEIDQAVRDAISQAEQELQGAVEPSQPNEESLPTGETGSPEEAAAPVEPVTAAAELTQVQKEEIEASIRAGYADRLSAARSAVQQAQQSVTDADAALEAFRQQQSSGEALSEQDLIDAAEQAQEAYDDAEAALETTKTTYGRAVNSANLPASTSNSAQIGQITYDQMGVQLEKLEALREAEGKILAPTDGIVTKCNVQTGEKTTDTTAVLLADTSQGCKFSGLATEQDSQYIGVGDKVLLQTGTGKSYKDLSVTTFGATEEPGGGYRLTVQIPADNLALGVNVHLYFTKKSQPYPCCVPLSALHLDSRNQPYVLVVQEAESVMGSELQARKVSVTVLEQNETMAALSGGLGSKDLVIVGSDKAIENGSRVRVE